MTSKPVTLLFAELGVTQTHSRPHVSNDNPYSEAPFKTLKYRPGFPDRFGSLEDAPAWCAAFVDWYNRAHHHAGLALHTPHDVHHGLAAARRAARASSLFAGTIAPLPCDAGSLVPEHPFALDECSDADDALDPSAPAAVPPSSAFFDRR